MLIPIAFGQFIGPSIKPTPQKPVAAFSASPTSGSIPLKVQFTDQSTNSPTSWKWDFGDGTTSTTHNPLHTYIKVYIPTPLLIFSLNFVDLIILALLDVDCFINF
jgi:PKD repeat protein